MSKGSKSTNQNKKAEKSKIDNTKEERLGSGYLFSMNAAPGIEHDNHWFYLLPASFFTAIIIMITRMAAYKRPMEQFFFYGDNSSNLNDFFSYYKMVAIIGCTIVAFVFLLYKIFVQSFYIKKSYAYIPMIVYIVFVLLSYMFSDYKLFALWGWVERFEGTLVLCSYMVMLFFIINAVNSEKNVKMIIYPLAVSSALLGLLGITQAANHDFFKTVIGKKVITPSWFWDKLDSLDFTFTTQIYQTVYNINYVSFYLTLLIPIFGILFIRSFMLGKEESAIKKVTWGALFTLLVFNLIGSASSGGLMGMAFVVLVAVIVLNKRILQWWKPVVVLLILTLVVSGITFERWTPELSNAVRGVLGVKADHEVAMESADRVKNATFEHKIDYMVTSGDAIEFGYQGEELIFNTFPNDPSSLKVTDASGKILDLVPNNESTPGFKMQDKRYDWISVKPGRDKEKNTYIIIITDGYEWPFRITEDGPKYMNGTGKLMDLRNVPAVGWKDNLSFGSGRGYIWSRTIPMIKDTIIIGHGADTYSIYFPQDDYVGKYDSGTFSTVPNIIVDKPHNMYFDTIIGTGCISMLALFVLWGLYLIQSFKIYWREKYSSFVSYIGAGIFLGICGFLVSGLVNDSSVSVMPIFYGLLGTGIAINIMLQRQKAEVKKQ